MKKFHAITCVVGWGFFYAFSFLAVTSLDDAAWMPATHAMLAFAGFLAGMLCWARIVGGNRPHPKPAPIRVAWRPRFSGEVD